MLWAVTKHTILRNFYITASCSGFSCIFELSHFCRTFLRNYNRDLFSSVMINKCSRFIISDGWKLHGLLQQEEWSRVAILPYFRMLHSLKFRRRGFEGGCGEGRESLFDIEPFFHFTSSNKKAALFLNSSIWIRLFQLFENLICTQAFGQQILQLLDLATVLAVPFFLLLCQYALKSVLLPLAPGVGLYLRVYVICGKR